MTDKEVQTVIDLIQDAKKSFILGKYVLIVPALDSATDILSGEEATGILDQALREVTSDNAVREITNARATIRRMAEILKEDDFANNKEKP